MVTHCYQTTVTRCIRQVDVLQQDLFVMNLLFVSQPDELKKNQFTLKSFKAIAILQRAPTVTQHADEVSSQNILYTLGLQLRIIHFSLGIQFQ